MRLRTMNCVWKCVWSIGLCGALVAAGSRLWGDEPQGSPLPKDNASSSDKATDEQPADDLLGQQAQVANQYRELEKILIRMSELTASTDPRRAALLRRAAAQSKDRYIEGRFDKLIDLLKEDRLSLAVKDQVQLQEDLVKLLDLLLSEDRGKRLESEKNRIRAYLKRVNKIIKEQKSLQSQTQRAEDVAKLADDQEQLAGKTEGLAQDIEKENGKPAQDPSQDDSPKKPSGDKGEDQPQNDKDKKPSDDESKTPPGDSGENAEGDGDKGQSDKKDGDKGEKKPGSPQKDKADDQPKSDPSKSDQPQPDAEQGDEPPSPGQQGGAPSPGEPGGDVPPPSPGAGEPQEPPQEENGAEKRLRQASQRMQEARRKLEEAERDGARDKQDQALRELEQAKAELEEILRQLREEEMARALTAIEARVRKMLEMQMEVYEGTKRVDRVPEDQRDRDDEIEAGRLSRREAEIVAEADKALALLREEGSAVALPEALTHTREDMEQIVVRLARAKVGGMTQGIEEDVIKALEEMAAALKKAKRDLEDKKMAGRQMPIGEMIEPPLVDSIAELKMIRSLQMRVNERTRRYGEMIKIEQADQPELLSALKRLAEREQRIHRVTRDIVAGRNE